MKFFAFIFGPWLRRTERSRYWAVLSLVSVVLIFCGVGILVGLHISPQEGSGWQEIGAVVVKAGTQPDPNGYDQTYTRSSVSYYTDGIEHQRVVDLQWWEHAGMGVPIWIDGSAVTASNPDDSLIYWLIGGVGGVIVGVIVTVLLGRLETAIARYDEKRQMDGESTQLHQEFVSI